MACKAAWRRRRLGSEPPVPAVLDAAHGAGAGNGGAVGAACRVFEEAAAADERRRNQFAGPGMLTAGVIEAPESAGDDWSQLEMRGRARSTFRRQTGGQ